MSFSICLATGLSNGITQSLSKIHLVIHDRGEILSFCLTPGNVDDRNRKVMGHLTKNLFGKLFADKGYVSKKLFAELLDRGVELITKQKKNAKNPGDVAPYRQASVKEACRDRVSQ